VGVIANIFNIIMQP